MNQPCAALQLSNTDRSSRLDTRSAVYTYTVIVVPATRSRGTQGMPCMGVSGSQQQVNRLTSQPIGCILNGTQQAQCPHWAPM